MKKLILALTLLSNVALAGNSFLAEVSPMTQLSSEYSMWPLSAFSVNIQVDDYIVCDSADTINAIIQCSIKGGYDRAMLIREKYPQLFFGMIVANVALSAAFPFEMSVVNITAATGAENGFTIIQSRDLLAVQDDARMFLAGGEMTDALRAVIDSLRRAENLLADRSDRELARSILVSEDVLKLAQQNLN